MLLRFTPAKRLKREDLRGFYSGSLFLCGGHPTLKDEPSLKALSTTPGLTVMAMNNAGTVVRPHLWVTLDKPSCYSPSLLFDTAITKFARANYLDEDIPGSQGRLWKTMPSTFFFRVQYPHPAVGLLDRKPAFSWHQNIFTMAVQLAYYLGFRRIYLAGCGFDINVDQPYSYESWLSVEQVIYNARTYDNALRQLAADHEHCRKKGLEIVSVTPGSRANGFLEFMSLDAAIEQELKTYPKAETQRVLHSSRV